MSSIPSNLILNYLNKKYLGVPNAFPYIGPESEETKLSRQYIINKFIYSQEIPDTAPNDLIIDNTFVAFNGGIRKYSQPTWYLS